MTLLTFGTFTTCRLCTVDLYCLLDHDKQYLYASDSFANYVTDRLAKYAVDTRQACIFQNRSAAYSKGLFKNSKTHIL